MVKQNNLSVIILAAGKGTRMKSSYPKALHQILGKPMLYYILGSAYLLEPKNVFVVVGYKKDLVKAYLEKDFPRAIAVDQDRQLGTAHAVAAVSGHRKKLAGQVLVLSSDCPLIDGKTLANLAQKQDKTQSSATILSTEFPDPAGYGRIVKDRDGNLLKVVEEADAAPDQKLIKQVNTSIYCFHRDRLFDGLKDIGSSNTQNEYYLTDIVEQLAAAGKKVSTLHLADYAQVLGVNDRIQLAEAEKSMQKKINEKLMVQGVTIRDPQNTYIQDTVIVGQDTIIHPGCLISGKTAIGPDCRIGPFSQIADSTMGDRTAVNASVVLGASIGKENTIGPYSYIRPYTHTGVGVKIGGFCEVKKSTIDHKSKVPHLSYVGDTHIGKGVNVGASCVTVNYDGFSKHKTIIEDGVFIGSDTMLVAPVRIGKDALVAAGSVITEDVPDGCLAIARGVQKNIQQGALRYREKKRKDQS